MSRAPRELTPLESALHFFGAELRRWRTLRELSQAGLGLLTHDSAALISKVEKASGFPAMSWPGAWTRHWSPMGRWNGCGRRWSSSD